MGFIKSLIQFIKSVAKDERIPERDKRVVLALVALIVSPIDLIPDWIPVIGLMDDLVMLSIVLDYFFNVLDDHILLSHYPWGMKSFVTVKRFASFITFLIPSPIKAKIWKYQGNPYKNS